MEAKILTPWKHAESSVNKWGGKPEDYIEIQEGCHTMGFQVCKSTCSVGKYTGATTPVNANPPAYLPEFML